MHIKAVFAKYVKLKTEHPYEMSLKKNPLFVDKLFQSKDIDEFIESHSEKLANFMIKIDNLK